MRGHINPWDNKYNSHLFSVHLLNKMIILVTEISLLASEFERRSSRLTSSCKRNSYFSLWSLWEWRFPYWQQNLEFEPRTFWLVGITLSQTLVTIHNFNSCVWCIGWLYICFTCERCDMRSINKRSTRVVATFKKSHGQKDNHRSPAVILANIHFSEGTKIAF